MTLTCGEECQLSAKILSSFADPRQGAITAPFINHAMGVAVFKGDIGVAVVRLKTGGEQIITNYKNGRHRVQSYVNQIVVEYSQIKKWFCFS